LWAYWTAFKTLIGDPLSIRLWKGLPPSDWVGTQSLLGD
jgi:hypothetical protein